MVRLAVFFVLASLAIYGAVKAYPLLSGPELALTSPGESSSVPGGLVTISGKALYTETLYLNGAPLLIDEEGAFFEELLLPKGGTVLSFTGNDRFGRSITKTRMVYVP